MSTQPSSATDPGTALIAALAERDFARLAGILTPVEPVGLKGHEGPPSNVGAR